MRLNIFLLDLSCIQRGTTCSGTLWTNICRKVRITYATNMSQSRHCTSDNLLQFYTPIDVAISIYPFHNSVFRDRNSFLWVQQPLGTNRLEGTVRPMGLLFHHGSVYVTVVATDAQSILVAEVHS